MRPFFLLIVRVFTGFYEVLCITICITDNKKGANQLMKAPF